MSSENNFILDECVFPDIHKTEELQAKIFQIIDSGTKTINLNLENLNYIDSSGIAFIVRILRRIIQTRNGCLILLNAKPQVLRVLDISAFDKMVDPMQLIIDRSSEAKIMPAVYSDNISRSSFVEKMVVSCRAGDLNCIREKLKDVIFKLGLEEKLSYDILVAVSEACSNSIEHSGCSPEQAIEIAFIYENGIFTAELKDFGTGFDPEKSLRRLPKRLSTRGRGIFIMETLMDTVSFENQSDGLYLKMQKIIYKHPAKMKDF